MKKWFINALIVVTILLCLEVMVDLPVELRFISTQYNYLYTGALYIVLSVLVLIRFCLIKDRQVRRVLLIVVIMLIVFPSLFVFSISLQHFTRVQKAAGLDTHLLLVSEQMHADTFIREYKMRDQGFAEKYGYGVEPKRSYTISNSSQAGFPTKTVFREEKPIDQYFKLVRWLQEKSD